VNRLSRADLAVVAVCAVVLVLVTADVVAGGLLTKLDEAISDPMPSSDDAPTWTRVVGLLGNLGVGGVAVVAASIATMHATLRWWPGVMAIGQLVATEVVVLVLKVAVGREGPSPEAAPDGYPGFYPSGHTATSVVSIGVVTFLLTFLLARRRGPGAVRQARRRGLAAGAVGGVVVGISTVLGGFHWVTDVVASLAIAAAVLVAGFGLAESHVAGADRRTTAGSTGRA
jgi:undecaprenyl-diphosphatase